MDLKRVEKVISFYDKIIEVYENQLKKAIPLKLLYNKAKVHERLHNLAEAVELYRDIE
jgi:hypothetical protein